MLLWHAALSWLPSWQCWQPLRLPLLLAYGGCLAELLSAGLSLSLLPPLLQLLLTWLLLLLWLLLPPLLPLLLLRPLLWDGGPLSLSPFLFLSVCLSLSRLSLCLSVSVPVCRSIYLSVRHLASATAHLANAMEHHGSHVASIAPCLALSCADAGAHVFQAKAVMGEFPRYSEVPL